MPVKLFSLRGVLDDEADEVRALLKENAIEFYETPPGNWAVSAPAIWLPDATQLGRAKALLEDYQRARAVAARTTYAQLKAAGKQHRLIDALREHPIRFIIYLSAAAAVLYVSTKPFIDLAKL